MHNTHVEAHINSPWRGAEARASPSWLPGSSCVPLDLELAESAASLPVFGLHGPLDGLCKGAGETIAKNAA